MEETGNWRKKIKKLNFQYLQIVREIGAVREPPGYAQTMLNLDSETINLLMSIDVETMHRMAAVGAPLFRLKLKDLKSAGELYQKGNGERAAGLLTAALAAAGTKEGEA